MRVGMSEFLTASEMPFTFAKDRYFEEFIQKYVQPAYRSISKNTARSDILKLFHTMTEKLKIEFNKFDGVMCFTSDCWSGRNHNGYACVTAHFIDNNWLFHKRIIVFRLLEYPHNGINLCENLLQVFNEFNVLSKLFSISFDNASANTACIELLKRTLTPSFDSELFHMRCVFHIYNLVEQDGLKLITPQISKIREAINYISCSDSRQQEFGKNCKNLGLRRKKFIDDIPNRWNSTFLMLKSCVGYTNAINAFINSKQHQFHIDDFDWNIAFKVMKFLKPFYKAAKTSSEVYYPTSNLVLLQFVEIANQFSSHKDDPFFYDIVCTMEDKFRKYYELQND